jgi:hypothetical protein
MKEPTFSITLNYDQALLLAKGLSMAACSAHSWDAGEVAEARWYDVMARALKAKAQELRPIIASLN